MTMMTTILFIFICISEVSNTVYYAKNIRVSGQRLRLQCERTEVPISQRTVVIISTATAICSFGHGLRTSTAVPRHPSGVAKSSTSFGWGKGGNVTSAGWQVTLCDRVWHVSSRSGKACCCILPFPATNWMLQVSGLSRHFCLLETAALTGKNTKVSLYNDWKRRNVKRRTGKRGTKFHRVGKRSTALYGPRNG